MRTFYNHILLGSGFMGGYKRIFYKAFFIIEGIVAFYL